MFCCPAGLRSKAARLVGAKCTLLARIDAYGQDPEGNVSTLLAALHCPLGFTQIMADNTNEDCYNPLGFVLCAPCTIAPAAVLLVWLDKGMPACSILCHTCVLAVLSPPLPSLSQTGKKFKGEMEAKIEKWQEPPPAKIVKPLEKPDAEVRGLGRGGG